MQNQLKPLILSAALSMGLLQCVNVQALPSYAVSTGNSCSVCHRDGFMGMPGRELSTKMSVTQYLGMTDLGTQLDGKTRGAVKTFRVVPGGVARLSNEVLDGSAHYAVKIKRLEKPGQRDSAANLLTWSDANDPAAGWTMQDDPGDPPGVTDPYFTTAIVTDGTAGVVTFQLGIDPATPPDVYDLEYAIAGKDAEGLWYQDEHFYLEVVAPSAQVAAVPYDTWSLQLPAESRGPDMDANGDGVLNLVKYAYGLDPMGTDTAGLPTVTYANGQVTFSYTKPKSVVGVQYIVRAADTVTQIESMLQVQKLSETATTETWGATLPASGPQQYAWSSLVQLQAPTLTGHAGASRPAQYDRTLPYTIQAAFNDDTFFWHVSYPGNEGKRHDYYRFTNGAWQKEGGDRRDGQSTLDNEEAQGSTSQKSTVYEQRTSIMMSDPMAASHVTDFAKFGCFVACHNQSRNMPEWTDPAGEDTKYINLADVADGGASSTKVLDLWHWRSARSNPIGRADDQHILAKNFSNTTSGDDGGRKGDAGSGVFTSMKIVDGHPAYVFDPATTGGKFAFNWNDFWGTPLWYITLPDASLIGPNAPNPMAMPWDQAVAAGYVPQEGDTLPRRMLRAGAGSRADITAAGTHFTRNTADTVFGQDIQGTWDVQLQRLLNTGNDDDVALVAGQTYNVAFEVHLWEYTARDHYVSFPMSLSLGAGGDIAATDLTGQSGRDTLPNWDDTNTFPVVSINLFQPGINTWEFLKGENTGKNYVDPVSGQPVGQTHGGAFAVSGGTAGCTSCHTVKTTDPAPPFNAGAMEVLTQRRGGIFAPTPVLQ